MKTRQGYYSEQTRNESYKITMADSNSTEKQYNKIINCFTLHDGWTMQEIEAKTGIAVHIVSARLNELRKDEIIMTDTERRKNPVTGRPNIVWKLHPTKFSGQLELF
ncbi:MarR family transcriptional regulator [Candidatus Nomurabacteria bacterium]|jgi:predicted ArsR family transcriptional regulator|nr:MarR family transcriptional regulator [Candidatus Nomurabacteria bacterium]